MSTNEGCLIGVAVLVCGVALGCGGRSEHAKDTNESSGGGAGMSGDGGTPDARPRFQSSKLDLLLVIDNSRSMADKQEVLTVRPPLWFRV